MTITVPQIDFELLDRWIEALRSGKYSQGTGHLRTGDDYCCLGVLCDISGQGEWVQFIDDDDYFVTKSEGESYLQFAPKFLMAKFALTGSGVREDAKTWELPVLDSNGNTRYYEERTADALTEVNDGIGASFEEIADLLSMYRDELKANATSPS